jgi:hypothetical protein
LTAPAAQGGPAAGGRQRSADAERQRSAGAWLRAKRRSLRRRHWATIALIVVLFLVISVLLARFLSTENVERDDILAVLQAQAKGDAQAMLNKLSGCRSKPGCVAVVKADAMQLRRAGAVKILLLKSKTAYALSSTTGVTRVAWTVIGKLPVVQCVRVRRTGNLLSGMSVTLLSIGPRISGEGEC